MKEKIINTNVRIYKTDVSKTFEEVVLYTSSKVDTLTEHQLDVCKSICGYLMSTNEEEGNFDSIEYYVKKVLAEFESRRVFTDDSLEFDKELNILIYSKDENEDLEEPAKVLAAFMLPIIGGDEKGPSTTGTEEAEKITELLNFNTFEEEKAEGKREKSPYTFKGIEDRRVILTPKTLKDAVDPTYELNTSDAKRLEEAKRLARTLSMYIMGKGGRGKTSKPRKRLSRRETYSDDVTKIYIDKKGMDDYGEFERTANIIIDCSGSMFDVFEDAKLLAEAVSLIPNIKGKVILTASSGSIDLEMPVPHEVISSFVCASGSEGLKTCLLKYEKDIESADVTIVLTDGDIVDGVPTQEFKAKHADKLIGALICEGTDQLRTSLRRHFSRIMIADTAKDLIDVIMARGKLAEDERDFTRSLLGLR